ncbi:hypothetical protein [Marinobacter caseinilyticus]|uniref:hypothetical protein n=1 Tax=Marinobacter caseinilyticus TaxID=2692195 RepID=UPI00140AB2AE|nr:hypothetical protein [Marinobacter caseinilyticus]
MLNQLRAALVVKAAEVRLSNEGQYANWVGINPMALLGSEPRDYLGECAGRALRPGQWCFKVSGRSEWDKPTGTLIFQLGGPITEKQQNTTRNQVLMWQVVVEYTDRNSNDRMDSKDLQTGLKLNRVGDRNETLKPNEFGEANQ